MAVEDILNEQCSTTAVLNEGKKTLFLSFPVACSVIFANFALTNAYRTLI